MDIWTLAIYTFMALQRKSRQDFHAHVVTKYWFKKTKKCTILWVSCFGSISHTKIRVRKFALTPWILCQVHDRYIIFTENVWFLLNWHAIYGSGRNFATRSFRKILSTCIVSTGMWWIFQRFCRLLTWKCPQKQLKTLSHI